MNIFEAKQILRQNGYNITKCQDDVDMIKEARRVVERAGYTVLSEGKRMPKFVGSVLADLAEEWVTGPYCKFEQVADDIGFEGAKAEFLDAVKSQLMGHGVSVDWVRIIAHNLDRYKNVGDCLLHLAEYMHGGNGMSKWHDGKIWC